MKAEPGDGKRRGVAEKLKDELKALGVAGLFFTCWLASLLLLKKLILNEYQIQAGGMSMAIMGALVLAKVVLILEHVSLGGWLRGKPAWLDVIVRTALYCFGVAVVLILEKAFEGRHEAGGFVASLSGIFEHPDIDHVYVNTLCLSGALLSFNVLTVIRMRLGEGGLRWAFTQPLPDER